MSSLAAPAGAFPVPTPATIAEVRGIALACLRETEPVQKLALTARAGAAIAAAAGALQQDSEGDAAVVVESPHAVVGRPSRPPLVAPRDLHKRKLGSTLGRAVLVHAVAHIEFNAINLAWDAVYRFGGLPTAYYLDWASVAVDEARHYSLLECRLKELGHAYGDFPAHDGLWTMAADTAHDFIARMALVPRVLEARGLDVTPAMIERARAAGDLATVAILELILAEEVRHVAVGTRWFRHACHEAGLDSGPAFLGLLQRFGSDRVRPPFNYPARLAAGFLPAELAGLERLAAEHSS